MSQRQGSGEVYANAHQVLALVEASNAALEKGELEEAIALRFQAVDLAPKNPLLQSSLGSALWLAGRVADAERAFSNALRLKPDDPGALAWMGQLKQVAGDFEDAEILLRRAVKADRSNVRAHLALVDCLTAQGKYAEGEVEAKAAIRAHPRLATPHSAYGTRLQQLGRFSEALEQFSMALDLDPTDGLAHVGRAQQTRFQETDRDVIQTMASLVSDPRVDDQSRVNLLYALGKAHDDLAEYGRAMECFVAANQLEDRNITASQAFPREEYERTFNVLQELFTSEFIQSRQVRAEPGPNPIFIVGMMRSGTSLVEQILSSHPLVEGAGEINFWRRQLFECIDFERKSFNFDRALGARKKYSKRLRAIAPNSRFVTDKMPDNYLVLGALRMLYPAAKFIHCVRHPVDTCLSIFMTGFHQPADYSSDPEKLVFIYQHYQRLMEQWKTVLPPDSLLDVKYEELIGDTVAISKRMIEFCGLEWDESCLQPQHNPRPVTTASLWQVRQPVYRTSVDRWRNYEPWLGTFRQLL